MYVKFMALKGDYLYCAGESDFRIFRTLNITERYHHASADYTKNITTSGNFAFVANEQNGLYILDISNPANPDQHGYLDTPGSASNVDVYGNLVVLLIIMKVCASSIFLILPLPMK